MNLTLLPAWCTVWDMPDIDADFCIAAAISYTVRQSKFLTTNPHGGVLLPVQPKRSWLFLSSVHPHLAAAMQIPVCLGLIAHAGITKTSTNTHELHTNNLRSGISAVQLFVTDWCLMNLCSQHGFQGITFPKMVDCLNCRSTDPDSSLEACISMLQRRCIIVVCLTLITYA